MHDPTENVRREMQSEINANAVERTALEEKHGRVWDTGELQTDFTVIGFAAPFVEVIRKEDGETVFLCFQHGPRLYWVA
jgi:hypothetical protein